MISLQAALVAMALSGTGSGETVLLDFYADWCGPCHAMDPTVKELKAVGFPVRQVNIDHQRDLASQFHVTKIPCFVMLVDGREVERRVGLATMDDLAQMCRKATAAAEQALAQEAPRALPMPAIQSSTPLHFDDALTPPFADRGDRPTNISPVSTLRPQRDSDFIACSVRLRVEDPEGRSCGSGTIIDSRQGEALVLTCGHIFRDSRGKGAVQVDLFTSNGVRQVAGQVVHYDLQRDVGLVSIRVPAAVAVARVAPAGYRINVGDEVVTVGCDRGGDPRLNHTRIAPGKYLGAPSVQVDEFPVTGRSGGGLFTPDGMIIGVCNAADPTVSKGLYASIESIQAELDRDSLAFVYRNQPAATAMAANDPSGVLEGKPRPLENVDTEQRLTVAPQHVVPGPVANPLPKEEQAFMDEVQKRLQNGAELIMIVRLRNNPQAPSEIIALDRTAASKEEQAFMDEVQKRLQNGAELIMIVRPRNDPEARSEIITLDRTIAAN